MGWLPRMLAGPILWALLFSAIYALHGAGCALDWPARATPVGPLHPMGLIVVWLAGLALHGALIAVNRRADTAAQRWLIRSGNWIGAVASAVTLLPVAITSTCG